jgi:hypothetical protein
MAENNRGSERGEAGDKVHSGSEGFGGVVGERDGTENVSREAGNSDRQQGNAGVSTQDAGTNSFMQQPREASSTGLEGARRRGGEANRDDAQRKQSPAAHTTPGNESLRDDVPRDTRGEPTGGRSQQDGGILREEDRGPGASGSVDDTPLA